MPDGSARSSMCSAPTSFGRPISPGRARQCRPGGWLDRYRGRIPLVHVKDIAPTGQNIDEDGWADVGMGVPWPTLWDKCIAAGAEIMIAEHDNPRDFERFARVSAYAMRRFSQGAL